MRIAFIGAVSYWVTGLSAAHAAAVDDFADGSFCHSRTPGRRLQD
jgi:hypothetical protein